MRVLRLSTTLKTDAEWMLILASMKTSLLNDNAFIKAHCVNEIIYRRIRVNKDTECWWNPGQCVPNKGVHLKLFCVRRTIYSWPVYCKVSLQRLAWASWSLKSPTTRLFVRKLVKFITNTNSKSLALLTIYEGNPLVTDGFPSQRLSNAGHQVMMSSRLLTAIPKELTARELCANRPSGNGYSYLLQAEYF